MFSLAQVSFRDSKSFAHSSTSDIDLCAQLFRFFGVLFLALTSTGFLISSPGKATVQLARVSWREAASWAGLADWLDDLPIAFQEVGEVKAAHEEFAEMRDAVEAKV